MSVKQESITEHSNHTRRKKHKFGWMILKLIMLVLFTTTIIGTFVGSAWVYSVVKNMPALDMNKIIEVNSPSTLYDSNGNLMDTIANQVQSDPIKSISEVPDTLKNAVVSIEDKRFYDHNGVDVRGILGAAFSIVMNKITGVGETRGGSTITQQIIKLKIIGLENVGSGLGDIDRKIKEAYLAMDLEKKMSKDDILVTYLNIAPMGGMIVGVKDAARIYFNKSLNELSLVECAFLAGLPQDPNRYGPYTEEGSANPELYKTRALTVLEAMKNNNAVTEDQFNTAVNDIKTNGIPILPLENQNVNSYQYGWFSLPVINQVKLELKRQKHLTDDQIDKLIYQGGLKIYTTMDRNLQDQAQNIINNDAYYGNMGVWENPDPVSGIKTIQPQAAAVVYDYHSGEVKCIIGGRFNADGSVYYLGYNRAIENGVGDTYIYPIGSTMKPIADYAPAINENIITAANVIEDAKFPPALQQKYASVQDGPYDPRNYDANVFYGWINIRKALRVSSNIVALKVLDMVGVDKSFNYLQNFGLTLGAKLDPESKAFASIGLGEYRANVMEMAKAYGVFGNGGVRTDEILFTKVLDKDGNVYLENHPKTANVITPQTAYVMYDLLKEPFSAGGTAQGISIGNVDVRGKTGTSSYNQNFTFAGLTPYYSGAVWMGNDGAQITYTEHSYMAAVIWQDIMRVANAGKPNVQLPEPDGVVRANICGTSGLLPIKGVCDRVRPATVYSELFTSAATIPTAYCNRHVVIVVNKVNGLIAVPTTPSNLRESRVYEEGDPAIPTRVDEPRVVPTVPQTNTTNTPSANSTSGGLNIFDLLSPATQTPAAQTPATQTPTPQTPAPQQPATQKNTTAR
ncbi:MAG: transglycosylase domain-containing protein [Oscillospiraceae bacterium]|nr:transglycosylase domain-containing protein [Oscillospiraceae bacterium]